MSLLADRAPNCHLHRLYKAPDMARAYASALRPLPRMRPSAFAEKYRQLKEGTTERPGPWRNDVFPYLVDCMDVIEEALVTGKRGVVLMKSGQGGGSEAMINALSYLLSYWPGPALYLIDKDELAREFGRERFSYVVATCEPLRRKALTGRGSGELVHIKRFVDGKLAIHGGRSASNLQSTPYRFVMIDEVDSLLDEMDGQDPLKMAEIRTDAFAGRTLIVAFAHPTSRERGAGRLYYELSDQRRGFVTCPHCGSEFWLRWELVRAVPEEGMNQAQAERDPRCYHLFAPCCGAEISDAQRYGMVQKTSQKSTLPAEEAAKKSWIGVHFSQLYMSNKPLRFLAEKWIEGIDNEPIRRVFVNKRLGEVFDTSVKDVSQESWRRLVVIKKNETDLEYYERGQVPRGVRFLTSGQDSGSKELHFAVWGWGLLRDEAGYPLLCGWLIDYGVVKRDPPSQTLDAAELRVFDQLIYDRGFVSTDGKSLFYVEQGLHDSGWQPIAAYEYCSRREFKAYPSKGAAADSTSTAPFLRWGAAPAWRIGDEQIRDDRLKLCLLNTYTLKEEWYGLVERRFKHVASNGAPQQLRTRLILPQNVGDDFIEQSASEYKALEKKKYVWKEKGPNHWGDCNVYAFALARNLMTFQQGLPFEEVVELEKREQDRAKSLRSQEQKQEPWIATDRGEGEGWIRE